jgi:molybdenum cofactor synthesis domain-containing protein
VVQFEDTEVEAEAGVVKIYTPVYPRQNISSRGKDIQVGQTVLGAETRLDPSKIGVLAALGFTEIAVVAKPTVAVIPSGNEIVAPGESLTPGKIYDINSYTLAALIRETGGIPRLFPVMRDTLEDVRRTLREALSCDLVVLSGGSSVGERDVMVEAVASMGEVKFHGIAVKPGKPTLCGVIEGRLVLGMPVPDLVSTNGYGLAPAPRTRHLPKQRRRVELPLCGAATRPPHSTPGPIRRGRARLQGVGATSMADGASRFRQRDLVEKGAGSGKFFERARL